MVDAFWWIDSSVGGAGGLRLKSRIPKDESHVTAARIQVVRTPLKLGARVPTAKSCQDCGLASVGQSLRPSCASPDLD